MGVWTELAQLRYPKEFRIPAPDVDEGWVRACAELVEASTAPPDGSTTGESAFTDETLADLATGLWRLRLKMVEPGTQRPLESMRRTFRHLESVWDLLAEIGLEVQDHTDTRFDSGMSLKVIAFQPDPGVARERIVETVKPSVYLGRRRIQMGEVIVATPEATKQRSPTA